MTQPELTDFELGDDIELAELRQGVYFAQDLLLTWTDDTDPDNPVEVRWVLEGWAGRGQVRKAKKLTAALLCTLTVDVSQITDVSNVDCGRVTFSAGATETMGLNRSGYFNIELFDPGDPDVVVRVLQGTVPGDLDVTADD